MSIIAAAVFSGTVVLGAVFLVVYFVRKRRISSNSDNGNGRIINNYEFMCPFCSYPDNHYFDVPLKVRQKMKITPLQI